MKKSLIALAVAGTFAAPAFAATENVDVYGKLHLSVSFIDDQPDNINDLQVTSNASRFGLKGAEDLGGGLSAIWQFESSLNLEETGGTLAGRNSFIGLKGGFGTVLAGNHDTPLKLVGRAVDLFGDTLADSRNVLDGGSDTRAKNVLVYMTPNMGGFGIAAAYTTDLEANGTSGERDEAGAYNLNATYKNGPIYVGLGYGDGDAHELAGLGAHMRLAAGLTFGNAKIVAQYDDLENDNSLLSGMDGDATAWMLGGAFTMGNIVLKANYMEGETDTTDNEQFTIGADYNLSKRSTVYALYVSGENIQLGSGAGSTDRFTGVGGGGDISALSVGMTHVF